MLKSTLIFKRNDAHLVEKKMFGKKKTIVHSQGLNVLNMQEHLDLCQDLSI
jgi:hypothetical protein